MILSAASRDFLSHLARRLIGENCMPVLLRNYQELPERIGNDLDLFVPAAKLDTARSILIEEIRRGGGIIGQIHTREYFSAYWVRFDASEDWWHIDLYPGALTWHGLPYLDDEALIAGARRYGDWPIPRPAHEALISLLTSVLWGGFVKQGYAEAIPDLLADPPEAREFSRCVLESFGKPGLMLGDAAISGSAKEVLTPALTRSLRSALRIRRFEQYPLATALRLGRYWTWETRCYLFDRPGLRIEYPKNLDEAPKLIIEAVGKLFGGVIFESLAPRNFMLRCMGRLRAYGGNFLVLTPGNQWRIGGKYCANPITEADSVRAALAQYMAPRLAKLTGND